MLPYLMHIVNAPTRAFAQALWATTLGRFAFYLWATTPEGSRLTLRPAIAERRPRSSPSLGNLRACARALLMMIVFE